MHADPEQAVFPIQADAVVASWRALLGDLATHLRAEGFEGDAPLRGFHRFYFAPDGRIDRVLYHLRDVDDARLDRYGELLDDFAQTYRFALEADRGFAQCSPVTLVPASE